MQWKWIWYRLSALKITISSSSPPIPPPSKTGSIRLLFTTRLIFHNWSPLSGFAFANAYRLPPSTASSTQWHHSPEQIHTQEISSLNNLQTKFFHALQPDLDDTFDRIFQIIFSISHSSKGYPRTRFTQPAWLSRCKATDDAALIRFHKSVWLQTHR